MSRMRTTQAQQAPCPNRMSPAIEARSQFLVRTSNFFKKVSKLGASRKASMDEINDSTRDAATFAARSVALGRKSFGFSQPVLGVQTIDGIHRRTMSDQDSDMSLSGTTSPQSSAAEASTSDRSSHHNGVAPQPRSVSLPTPMHNSIPNAHGERPPPVPPKGPPARYDGLPRSTNPPFQYHQTRTPPNGTYQQHRVSTSEFRSQTLPSRKFVTPSSSPTTPPSSRVSVVRSPPISPPLPRTPMSTPTSTPRTNAQTTEQSLARDRSLHLRLASLPPPMMARYNTQGSARLTPSVVHRPMPMPILNLPMLPPSTPAPHSGEQREGRTAPLRSMPALPLNGPRDDENPEMDEEGSDSSDDGEVDDGDGDDHSMGDGGVSDDEPETPSPQLPEVDTSPLGISISFIAGRSAAAQQRLREIEREAATLISPPAAASSSSAESTSASTPTVSSPTFPPRRTSSLDYFSHRIQASESTSTSTHDAQNAEDTVKTPRPSDFAAAARPANLKIVPSVGKEDHAPPISQGSSDPSSSSEYGALPKIVPIPPTPISPLPPSLSSKESHSPGRIVGQSTVTPASPSPPPETTLFRPGLYHHASKSMVDLTPYSRKAEKMKEDFGTAAAAERRRSPLVDSTISEVSSQEGHGSGGDPQPLPSHTGTPGSGIGGGVSGGATPQLRRQRSLPTYSPATLPPPYPAFFGGGGGTGQPPHHHHHQPVHNIQPREEEGNERLPAYSNSILLVAMMPRKMEFVAPGIQARERKWRRVIVVLEGTALKVYRTHGAGSQGKGGKVGQWWERAVGVGDWSSSGVGVGGVSGAQGVRASALRERERRLAVGVATPPLKGEREPEPEPEPEPHQTGSGSDSAQRPVSRQESPTSAHSVATTPTSGSRSTFFQSAAGLLHPSRSGQGSRLGSPSVASASRSRSSFDMGRERDREDEMRTPPGALAGRRSMDILNVTSTSSRNLSSSASPSTISVSASSVNRSRSGSSNANASSYTNMSAYSSGGSSGSRVKGRFMSVVPSESQRVAVPGSKDLIRVYTLQNAESGLASDYTKRKNVIRLRTEGEQFLLQARDVGGVIDWIEGIQAATNIALDLDERPMPKGPLFPRRRRRRRRPDGTAEPPRGALEPASLRHQPAEAS